MKKQFLLLGILTLSLFIIIPACNDDDDEKTKTEILTSGSWITTAATVDPGIDLTEYGQGVVTDLYNNTLFYPECAKDDYTTFSEDGTYETNIAGTPCDDTDTNESGTWAFNEDETKIYVDKDTEDEILANIESFSDNKIVFSYTVEFSMEKKCFNSPDGSNSTHVLTETMEKQ